MIDIFGGGPYLPQISELFLQSLEEFGRYFFHFAVFAAAVFFLKSRLRGFWEMALVLLLSLLQIAWVWTASIPSEWFLSLCLAALLTAQVRILDLLPLRPLDYGFLFAALLFPARLFNSTSAVMGHLWIFWIVFCALYTAAWLGLGTLRGNQFHCYFLFVLLSFSMYSWTLIFLFLAPAARSWLSSPLLGYLVPAAVTGGGFLSAAWLIRVKAARQLEKLNRLGASCRPIEKGFFFLSGLLLFTFTLMYLPATLARMQNAFVSLLIPLMCLTFLGAQCPFLLLLLRFVYYRDSATFHEWEKEGLASYYEDWDRNLSAMQEMRHDIKNIFFTMGSFVDRSDDQEMKDFFWQKIYPYSVRTIETSALLSQLYQIPGEALRAFFHLKLSQALQQELSLHFEVALDPETFQTGIDIIDLTRILGILMDNAIEEAEKLPHGTLEVKIAGNETGCSYVIKNPVTEETRHQGVRPGQSSKGAGRGNGLRIVQGLLERYPNAVLNASMQRDVYIQSLNITFPGSSHTPPH